jgi:hypothetical protein
MAVIAGRWCGEAHIAWRRALRYRQGADAAEDRPAHVRAASGCCWWGERLAIVQDDANFLALASPDGLCEGVALPSRDGVRLFDRHRGNRLDKPDLEAVCVVGDRLVAFGSGSLPIREVVCVFEPAPRWVDARPLFGALAAACPPGPTNLEGATVANGSLWLFRRGTRGVVDAMARLDVGAFNHWLGGGPAPPVQAVAEIGLPAVQGVALGVTGAITVADKVWISAAAEDAPDAVEDGPVLGSAVGCWSTSGIDLWRIDAALKVEGLAAWNGGFLAVTDPDDPDVPSELLYLTLGPQS